MPSKTIVADTPETVFDASPPRVIAARVEWIDSLKGAGILLVVFGHALGGLIDAGFAANHGWLLSLFAAIYIFHMPLFFFLTGLFVTQRVQQNPNRFRVQLVTDIAWPYFLWGGIQIVAINLAGTMVNHPSGPLALSFVKIFYTPPSQFWFLYALFFLHGLSLLIGRGVGSPFYFLLLLAVGSLAEQQHLPGIWQAIAQMAPYYGLGVLLGPILLAQARFDREPMWLLSVPVAVIAAALTMAHAIDLGVPGEWPAEAAAIAGDVRGLENFYAAIGIITALICVARLAAPAAPRWLIQCGKRTMPIFVLHILFIASTRIVVLKIDPTMSVYVLLPILCAAGVLIPLAAAAIADRLGVSRWVGFR